MMDCGGEDGGLEDFVDLATDIADSSSTIRGNLSLVRINMIRTTNK